MAKDKNHKGKYSHTGGNSRPLRGTVYFKNGKWYKKPEHIRESRKYETT